MRPLDAFLSKPEQRLMSMVLVRPDQDFGTLELLRRMGNSRGAGSTVLKRWVDSGLLRERKVGNQRRLSANPQFVLYPELRQMVLKTVGLTEPLAPMAPQYLGDLVSWTAIGARTTESQTHREMASGLSSPVGFKNGTDGSIHVALNAMLAASTPHAFLGIDFDGRTALTFTAGNPFGHLFLRGGATPNYDSVCVAQAVETMTRLGLPARIVVDCSHGNSCKRYELQSLVLRDVAQQVRNGNRALKGAMLESHLVARSQKLEANAKQLTYGQSVTDACLGWEDSRSAVLALAETLG